ncbi:hypothetical protein PoB_003372200 [Plakobranchus ocellatus]|uniref:Uncharacterized protein n=1 Tax=Plakobranchus ocellatus TaxID=259542 RepID=A0AAV4AJN2_9GAST|nr:hypothetical protein PoB_003372200 [Plakobranchus ocellatus]
MAAGPPPGLALPFGFGSELLREGRARARRGRGRIRSRRLRSRDGKRLEEGEGGGRGLERIRSKVGCGGRRQVKKGGSGLVTLDQRAREEEGVGVEAGKAPLDQRR